MKVGKSAETYQVGAHFKALIKAILVAPSRTLERFFSFHVSLPRCVKLFIQFSLICQGACRRVQIQQRSSSKEVFSRYLKGNIEDLDALIPTREARWSFLNLELVKIKALTLWFQLEFRTKMAHLKSRSKHLEGSRGS